MNFRFGAFEIDLARHELRRARAVVQIEPQVFDLLVLLVRNRDRVVGKDELIDAIWQGRIVSDATLSSRISSARRALGDSGNDQTYIRTLYKRGFRFVGEVDDGSPAAGAVFAPPEVPLARADDGAGLVPEGEPLPLGEEPAVAIPAAAGAFDAAPGRSADVLTVNALSAHPSAAAATAQAQANLAAGAVAAAVASESPVRRAAQAWRPAAALVGLLSLPVAAWWLLHAPAPPDASHASDAAPLAREAALAAEPAAASAPSIVVLPFSNLSGDAQQDYVADGITDSLISDLARALPGTSVISRDTAFTYKGRGVDAPQIGRELDVRYLLEGSVVVEGERVRVNIRLVDTRDGSQLGAERFDTARSTMLQVQDEIVGRVSRAIGLKVVDIEARRSLRERPNSTEVADLILRAKAVLNLPSSPATMIEARGLFEQALKVRPDDADGLAGAATTLVFEFVNGYYEAEGDQRLQRAEPLLDRAVTVDPHNLMALKARAALRRAQGKFEDAIARAQAVIAENPSEPWAYKEIGLSTMYLGRPQQALDWFSKADRIGPRDPGRWSWLDGRGHALILLARDEEATHALISALDANPGSLSSRAFLAAAYALLGRDDDAHASMAAYLQKRPDTRVSTFRRLSPVPFVLTSPQYQLQHERLSEGLREAGMPE